MTFYEIQQLLKKYGTIIYTGNRLGDLELMEEEIRELYHMGMIEEKIYLEAKMSLLREIRLVESKEI